MTALRFLLLIAIVAAPDAHRKDGAHAKEDTDSLAGAHATFVSGTRNVLFIAIDDLRPALGCYGDEVAITPNIDRLALSGTVFNRAYCQLAVCCPSRLSLLSGRRPDTIRVWDLNTHFRDAMPDIVTLPQVFKNHGYHTRSIGKILHGNGKPSQDPPSWSVDPRFDVAEDDNFRYVLPANLTGKGAKRASCEIADVPDNVHIDGRVCDAALRALDEVTKLDQPFFLAVGFRKPHLPFACPKKYWDLYDRDEIPLPTSMTHPAGAPEYATRSWHELEGYSDIPNDGNLSQPKVRELRHGYYACVSYVDSLLGRLLDELHRLGQAEQTAVVIWGDHGFHLGEQGLWTKANNYELSTRVPLIVSIPGQKTTGSTTNALVELVDVYPTIAEACSVDLPTGLEGTSLLPLLDQPDQPFKQAVFSQYPRATQGNRHKSHGDVMGYAVRTQRYRYVEWQEWSSKRVIATELYDHQADPEELRNVASDTTHSKALKKLTALLSKGRRDVQPNNGTGH